MEVQIYNVLHCCVADLKIRIPSEGNLEKYLMRYETNVSDADVIQIKRELYRFDDWPTLSYSDKIYMESGIQFYAQLLRYNGLMLHASAVAYGGKAYLFSGNCGAGKSTHTRLWQSTFGEDAKVFNDDKPALRRMEDRWYAYGTPWCGKDHININMKVPLAGICFLKQATENKIRRLDAKEAIPNILRQTLYKLKPENMELLLPTLDKLVREIPVFELENRPEPEAAMLSYETMRRAAEEAGL